MHTAHSTEEEEDGRVGGASVHGAGSIGNGDSYIKTEINTAPSKEVTWPTFVGAGTGINLVIASAVMRYEPKALRKCVDQFSVESACQLLISLGQLAFV
jgi:hypothetical protein